MDFWEVLHFFEDSSILGKFLASIGNLPVTTGALILGMSLIGTSLVNSLMKRESGFEFLFTLCTLIAGGLVANVTGIHLGIPVSNEVIEAAILTDLGLVLGALWVMLVYSIFDPAS